MELFNAVIHEIYKEQQSKPTFTPAKKMLSVKEPIVIKFVEELLKLYESKGRRQYGSFEDNADTYPFQNFIVDYRKDNSENNFYDFSIRSMKHLNDILAKSSAIMAKGGYIIFIEFKNEEDVENNFLIAMLRNTSGYVVNADSGIKELEHIDMKNLRQAVMIELDLLDQDDPKCISFIKHSTQNEVADYFIAFIGCKEFSNNQELTESLIKTIKQYTRDTNNAFSPEAACEIEKRAFEYCRDKNKNDDLIDIEGLSAAMHPDEIDKFKMYLVTNKIKVNNNFKPDEKTLKKLIRYIYKDKDVSFNFDRQYYARNVVYDANNKKLTIHNLSDKLIAQISEWENDN